MTTRNTSTDNTPSPGGQGARGGRAAGSALADALETGQGNLALTAKSERLRALAESTPVSEIMSRSVVCLAPDARVSAITEMFLERGISSAPVVDDNWHPLGMLSKTDLLRTMAEAHDAQIAPHADAPPKVGDITTPFVLSLHEGAPLSVAAAMMAYEGIHRLPIVAAGGEVVGVISTLDIVRWLTRCTDLEVGAEGNGPV